MNAKLLRSLGKLLFLSVLGVIVLKKYQGIFSLNLVQSIVLAIFFIITVFSANTISGWLGKHLPWKESVLEWLTIGVMFVLLGTVYKFFVL